MSTILHVIDTTGPGGAENVFINLADKLRSRQHASVVLIRGEGWVADELRRRGLEPIIEDASGSFNIRFLLAMRRIVKDKNIDLIQSHLLGSNVYCAALGLLTGKPVVATYHGMVDINPQERFRRIKLWLMQHGVSRFVCVSKRLAEAVAERELLDLSKTQVVYNGIDLERYQLPRSVELRQRLKVPDDALLLGCLGNIRPAKAYDVLIQALPEILSTHPECHVAIAGQGGNTLQKNLERQADDLGVQHHIHFLGYCDDSAEFLSQLDGFVLCSSSEGFSISTIEAMASGLPVLATRCGGPEEILSEGGGLLVDANSSKALAAGIIELIASIEAWKPFQPTRFSLAVMLDAYQGIYSELTS